MTKEKKRAPYLCPAKTGTRTLAGLPPAWDLYHEPVEQIPSHQAGRPGEIQRFVCKHCKLVYTER